MNTMQKMTNAAMTPSTIRMHRLPAANCCCNSVGSRATMPAKMMSEMPLPTPFSVINSPSHMANTVPAVSEIRTVRVGNQDEPLNSPKFVNTCAPVPLWLLRASICP